MQASALTDQCKQHAVGEAPPQHQLLPGSPVPQAVLAMRVVLQRREAVHACSCSIRSAVLVLSVILGLALPRRCGGLCRLAMCSVVRQLVVNISIIPSVCAWRRLPALQRLQDSAEALRCAGIAVCTGGMHRQMPIDGATGIGPASEHLTIAQVGLRSGCPDEANGGPLPLRHERSWRSPLLLTCRATQGDL